jgi:hypothetical protein
MRARPFLAAVATVLAACATGIAAQVAFDAQKQSLGSHAERPAAGVSAPPPLVAVGGDHPGDLIAFTEIVYALSIEEHEREAQRVAQPRSTPGGGVAASGACDLIGWTLPDAVLWRESRCSLDAFNATGCGGRGCVGAAQLDLGHFAAQSPWGGPGGCADLDATVIADQQECVRRLSAGGSNLTPWR